MPLSTCAVSEYFAAQGITLIDGQQAEAALEACDWIMEIGRRLERGFVLTIDYGHEAHELFDAHHMAGTVLAYANHRASEEYFAAPGEQDLTAHVNFTAMRLWGERASLSTLGLVSQTAFLLALGQKNEFADLYDDDASETERVRARLQLKTFIFPEGMGERFQVLIQQKGQPPADPHRPIRNLAFLWMRRLAADFRDQNAATQPTHQQAPAKSPQLSSRRGF